MSTLFRDRVSQRDHSSPRSTKIGKCCTVSLMAASSPSPFSLYIVYLFIGKFCLTYISMVWFPTLQTSVITHTRQICFRLISLRASGALRLEYTQALFSLPMSKLDEMSVGTVTHAITALSNTIQQSVSDRLAILFQSLALLISAYAIAFRYSWALTLVVSSAIVFVILGFSLTVPFLVRPSRVWTRQMRSMPRSPQKYSVLFGQCLPWVLSNHSSKSIPGGSRKHGNVACVCL